MILEAFVLSIILGAVRKGSLKGLARMPLRHLYLFVLPFVTVATANTMAMFGAGELWRRWLLFANVLQYLGLLAAILVNLHLREMWVVGLGTLSNLLAISANGGLMPVSEKAARAVGLTWLLNPSTAERFTRHAIMSPKTHLNPLGDIIPIPGRFPFGPEVVSIGDILVAIGIFVLIQRYMCLRENPNNG